MSNMRENFRGVKDDARERLSGDLDILKTGLAQLTSDVGHVLGSIFGAGKSSAREGVETARSQATSAVDRAKEGYEDLRAKGNDSIEQLGDTIGERPMTSALIAFGVGFVLAKILTRR